MRALVARVAVVENMLALAVHPKIGATAILRDSTYRILGDGKHLLLYSGCQFDLYDEDGELHTEIETPPEMILSEDELEKLASELFSDISLVWVIKDTTVKN